jgi:precorrin-6B methylase 2
MSYIRVIGRLALAVALLGFGALGTFAADEKKDEKKKKDDTKIEREPDVIYIPTPQEVVDRMLEEAKVKKDDVVYDLGCGDGRIVLTAARKYNCKAHGCDIASDRIKECEANKKKEKAETQKLVTFEQKDMFKLDVSKATVVTLYLLPEMNDKLVPQLNKMKAGSRIVSHAFELEKYVPDKTIEHKTKDDRIYDIYVYTIPLKLKKE